MSQGLAGSVVIRKPADTFLEPSTLQHCGGRVGKDIPQETAHNMLQEPSRLLLDQLPNHVAQDRADGVEPLVRRADVVETVVVE